MGSLEVLDITVDKVISSLYITVKMDYSFALENLPQLVNQLEFQRNTLSKDFYSRLKEDIVKGAIMPSITIAYNDEKMLSVMNSYSSENYSVNPEYLEHFKLSDLELDKLKTKDIFEIILKEHISNAFILDGIQRINTLNSIEREVLELNTPLYANVIVSNSMNKLLYRMIILNNGQRPMSARHQVEILLGRILDKEINNNNLIVSEKESVRGSKKKKISKDALIKGYLAFSAGSTNIDNQKIIESKLDSIISEKIIESKTVENKVEFSTIFSFITKHIEINPNLVEWLNNENNMIGLFSGIYKNGEFLNAETDEVEKLIGIVEETLSYIKASKIRVSTVRRAAVEMIIDQYPYSILEPNKVIDKFLEERL